MRSGFLEVLGTFHYHKTILSTKVMYSSSYRYRNELILETVHFQVSIISVLELIVMVIVSENQIKLTLDPKSSCHVLGFSVYLLLIIDTLKIGLYKWKC